MTPFFPGPVLAIESSCDETSAAVVEGPHVRANVVASQTNLHAKWGGVVPEAAARAHVEAVLPVVHEALSVLSPGERPAAVAVTNRPGLIGALSVGVSAAKALACLWRVPIVPIHHIEGHILSVLAGHEEPPLPAPWLTLVVSGGHTELVLVEGPGRYRLLGETVDDAAGEAFDKGGRLLGLGYPGGRAVQEAAQGADPRRYRLPRAVTHGPYDFSFSGLKTAVLRLVEREGSAIQVRDAAAALQEAVVDALATKAMAALAESGARGLALVGGVAANLALRERLAADCDRVGAVFLAARLDLCTDNAAMIGLAGSIRLAAGERAGLDFDCEPNAPLPGLIG